MVVETGAVVVEVLGSKVDPVSTVELVVGTTRGAPAVSVTSSDAAATTHHAASVTRVVASIHPSACRAVIICPSCPISIVCVSLKPQGFPKTVVVRHFPNRLPGKWHEST